MKFKEIYPINYAWKSSTILTVFTTTFEYMKASEVRRKYGDYTVELFKGDRVWLSNLEEE